MRETWHCRACGWEITISCPKGESDVNLICNCSNCGASWMTFKEGKRPRGFSDNNPSPELERFRKENKELKEKNSKQGAIIISVTRERDDSRRAYRELSDRCSGGDVRRLGKGNLRLTAENKELQEKQKELQVTLGEFQITLESSRECSNYYSRIGDDLRKENVRFRGENKKLQEEIDFSNTIRETQRCRIRSLQEENCTLQDTISCRPTGVLFGGEEIYLKTGFQEFADQLKACLEFAFLRKI